MLKLIKNIFTTNFFILLAIAAFLLTGNHKPNRVNDLST